MTWAQSQILLRDYSPPEFLIPDAELSFELDSGCTKVHTRLRIVPNPKSQTGLGGDVVLDAEELDFVEIKIDDQVLSPSSWEHTGRQLRLKNFPARGGWLECAHTINPEKNHALSGLYVSDGILCTQCEPEGFRRISCFLDRPDVLTRFTVSLVAEQNRYPVLLSNGNLISQGQLPDGRHKALWEDPWPKPSYLFALVAGDLKSRDASYKSRTPRPGTSGEVKLSIYASEKNIGRVGHALDSLVRAMRWDEETFNRHYDLDRYIIVAVNDFNSGAMENKGLNLFNSSYILADSETATDEDYATIDAVIAHEYFHNWTGNRVTCRDWFQLSLKEGLTVFRENLYMYERHSCCMRVAGIRYLHTSQFPEDAGPTAHPVQPDAYQQISNFYTATIYEKGAEIIGMLYRMIGRRDFLRGMDVYFERYDGQAVTIQDLVGTLLENSRFRNHPDINLQKFNLWYRQKGTPQLSVEYYFDEEKQGIVLDLRQLPPRSTSPGKEKNGNGADDSDKANGRTDDSWQVMPIPVALSVIDKDGHTRPADIEDDNFNPGTHTFVLCQESHRLILRNADADSIPIILEDFSAPVILHTQYTPEDLKHLALHAQDPYTRWQVIQYIALTEMNPLCAEQKPGDDGSNTEEQLLQAQHTIEADEDDEVTLPAITGKLCQDAIEKMESPQGGGRKDFYMLAEYLTLPSERFMLTQITPSDPAANRLRRRWAIRHVLRVNQATFFELYDRCLNALSAARGTEKENWAMHAGLRKLANVCLAYLCQAETLDDALLDRLRAQYDNGNLTMKMGVLCAINPVSHPLRDELLDDFAESIGDNLQLKEKCLLLIATSGPDATERIRRLLQTDKFDIHNPNQVHALIYGYCRQNPASLHAHDGSGYRLITDCVLRIDEFNPHLSARLAKVFGARQFLVSTLNKQIASVLDDISERELSAPLAEIIEKCRTGGD